MKNFLYGSITLIFLVLIINIIWLDLKLMQYENNLKQIKQTDNLITNRSNIPLSNTTYSTSDSAKLAYILDQIKMSTSSLTQKISLLQSSQNITGINQTSKNTNSVKEYYLPIGTGSTNAIDWSDIPGAEIYVAPENYGKIKEMYFEAGIRIPTGEGRVYARLKNVTDNVGLIESEVYQDQTDTKLVSSGKIPIPSTTKLYQVQMKSTMGVIALLESARIKIFIY